jgi:DNA-binding PadR family transcriptional regulator
LQNFYTAISFYQFFIERYHMTVFQNKHARAGPNSSNLGYFQLCVLKSISELQELAYGKHLRYALSNMCGRPVEQPQVYKALLSLRDRNLVIAGDKCPAPDDLSRNIVPYTLSEDGKAVIGGIYGNAKEQTNHDDGSTAITTENVLVFNSKGTNT